MIPPVNRTLGRGVFGERVFIAISDPSFQRIFLVDDFLRFSCNGNGFFNIDIINALS